MASVMLLVADVVDDADTGDAVLFGPVFTLAGGGAVIGSVVVGAVVVDVGIMTIMCAEGAIAAGAGGKW